MGGVRLEGAGWDSEACCLQEPKPMELTAPLPVVQFRPTEGRRAEAKRRAARVRVLLRPSAHGPARLGASDDEERRER